MFVLIKILPLCFIPGGGGFKAVKTLEEDAKKLLSLFNRREKIYMVIILFLIILMALAQTIGVVSVLPFMDLLLNPEMVHENELLSRAYNMLGFEDTLTFLYFAGIAMFFIILISNGISILATWAKHKFIWRKSHHLSMRLLRRYTYSDYSFFLQRNSSDLSKNILQEVKQLTKYVLQYGANFITYSLVALLIVISMLVVNPLISFFALLLMGGVYGGIYLFIRRRLKQKGDERLEANRYRYKYVNEIFNGIKDVKINDREEYFIDKFREESRLLTDNRAYKSVVGKLPRYFLEVLIFGGILLLSLFFMQQQGAIDGVIPLLSFYAFAAYRLRPALNKIFKSATKIRFNKAVLDMLHEEFSRKDEEIVQAADRADMNKETADKTDDDRQDVPDITFADSLQLENITFYYPEENKPALRNINMEIAKGESIGIVGRTGAGKTTLVDIILGLLKPQLGEVKVDGQPLSAANVKQWQQKIGYVPQEIFISDDTIKRNIAFGVEEDKIDIERVKSAAAIASIDTYIENELDKGYETILGERGINFSGGQRQRIGLARALYFDPEVLVLDEATNSLDNNTQQMIIESLSKITRVKTLITIAHRLKTVEKCDRLYLLEEGELADEGRYEELMESSDSFRSMVRASR